MTRKRTIKAALFFLLLISGQIGVHAQTRYRFDPRFKFSYDWGMNKMKPNSLSFDFIAGLHTSEQSSVGIGLGYSSHSHLFHEDPSSRWFDSDSWFHPKYKTVGGMALYLNGKHNFTDSGRLRPYIGIDVGYNWFSASELSDTGTGGFFMRPQLGIDYCSRLCRLFFEVNYKHMKVTKDDNINGWLSQFGIGAGFSLEL